MKIDVYAVLFVAVIFVTVSSIVFWAPNSLYRQHKLNQKIENLRREIRNVRLENDYYRKIWNRKDYVPLRLSFLKIYNYAGPSEKIISIELPVYQNTGQEHLFWQNSFLSRLIKVIKKNYMFFVFGLSVLITFVLYFFFRRDRKIKNEQGSIPEYRNDME